MADTRHASRIYVIVVILTAITLVTMLALNGYYAGVRGLFDEGENSTRPDNEFEITPASWAFSVWGVIYIWQIVFVIYCMLSLITKLNLHRVPILVFLFYILNNLSNIAWLVVADQYIYWAGVGTIAALPITLYICMIISIHKLNNRDCKFHLYTYAVHNAWAVYAGWTTVATLLYTGISLIYGEPDMEQEITGTIMLGILMGELVIFCSLELTVLDRYLRHIWSHYIALIFACAGSVYSDRFDPNKRNCILAVAIAGFVACAFFVKMMRILAEKCRRPDVVDPHSPKRLYVWEKS